MKFTLRLFAAQPFRSSSRLGVSSFKPIIPIFANTCSVRRYSTATMSVPTQTAPTKVFIAGGSYAGLSAALNLIDLSEGKPPRMAWEPEPHLDNIPKTNFEITIVDERDGWYHTIGSPLALSLPSYANKAWVKFTDIPALQHPSLTILSSCSISTIDPSAKTATIINNTTKLPSTHSYDYFIAATGLRRAFPVVPQSLTKKSYLLEAEEHIHNVHNATNGVLIVGGGAVGIEMAAELKMVKPEVNVVLAHSRDELLSSEGLDKECKDKALELLREAGVEVLLGHRLASEEKVGESKVREVKFTNGAVRQFDQVIMAISKSVPSTGYLPKEALDAEGLVKINKDLTFASGIPNASSHYCAGDAALWSGIKRCGGAMHGGHYSARNIHQHVLSSLSPSHIIKLSELQEDVPPMIGLAIGKKAVASGPPGTTWGEDVMQAYFRDDLGWTICWDYMKLGGEKKVEVIEEGQKKGVERVEVEAVEVVAEA